MFGTRLNIGSADIPRPNIRRYECRYGRIYRAMPRSRRSPPEHVRCRWWQLHKLGLRAIRQPCTNDTYSASLILVGGPLAGNATSLGRVSCRLAFIRRCQRGQCTITRAGRTIAAVGGVPAGLSATNDRWRGSDTIEASPVYAAPIFGAAFFARKTRGELAVARSAIDSRFTRRSNRSRLRRLTRTSPIRCG